MIECTGYLVQTSAGFYMLLIHYYDYTSSMPSSAFCAPRCRVDDDMAFESELLTGLGVVQSDSQDSADLLGIPVPNNMVA